MSGVLVAGVDPSITRTGLALPSGETMSFVGLPPQHSWEQRVTVISNELIGTLEAAGCDVVVIESPMVRGAVHMPTYFLHGNLRLGLWAAGITVVEANSSRRQKWACGGQKSRDKDDLLVTAKEAGSSARNNDEADAWWFRDIGMSAYNPTAPFETLVPWKWEVLAAIEWPTVRCVTPAVPVPPKRVVARKKAGAA